jgi:hypothetical protein
MDIQKPIDYYEMFRELLSRRAQLIQQRDATEREIVKVRQLILAIFPLLPDGKDKNGYQQAIDDMEAEGAGLQDAVKLVFTAHKTEWMTVSNVRDYLKEMGFELTHYQANPLSSIGTTLKRLVPVYLETKSSEGTTVYRYRLTRAEMLAGPGKNKAFYGE